jgi:hypothetical protein
MKAIRSFGLLAAGISILYLTSCKKETSTSGTTTPDQISQTAVALQAVAVGTVDNSSSSSSADSIYAIHACEPRHKLDSVAFSSLPSSILDYLNTNYAGYTEIKALVAKDSSGNVKGYAVFINFNGNPVGLRFDASGNFVKVLELREGRDLDGKGWHEGGCFGNRDGRGHDSLSVASLGDSIKTYFATNYPTDTLLAAFKQRDGEIVVLSRNNGAFATVFTSGGSFLKREEFRPAKGHAVPVTEAQLPSTVTSYLTSTYPGYTFKFAFALQDNTQGGYLVFIDANNTKYALLFDATGAFVKVLPVR